MRYALIDESGRLYDPNDKILVFGLVVTEDLSLLENIITRARERIPTKGTRKRERLSEIKFSKTGDKTRRYILQELAKQHCRIFSLIINKEGRKIEDTPENYALLISEILNMALEETKIEHVLIDKHFTFITQREQFNEYVRKQTKLEAFIEHVDSLQNPVVTLADFVAGAVRLDKAKRITIFEDYFRERIVQKKEVFWKAIKKR